MSGSRSHVVAARSLVLAVFISLVIGQVTLGRSPEPIASGSGPATASSASVEAGLLDKLRSGELRRFMVDFAARADLTPAWHVQDHGDRGRMVVNRLDRAADQAQAEARQIVADTRGASYQSFSIRNSMLVRGSAALAQRIAQLDGVVAVRAPKTFAIVKPVEQTDGITPNDSEPTWGVSKIGADEAWADGVLGTGVVIASIDTGVDYLHEALVEQYRGNNGDGTFDHNYNWWDPTGICGDEPCDNAEHGTHTMGTMVGGDGPGPFTPDIGVAPGARWMAAKGCEDLFCSEQALLSAGEFILAPTDLNGDNPDPETRPDIVNNSWGGGPGDPWYLDLVTAWRASGIIPVFSSGNPGPECGFGGSPGDYLESFSAGATDVDDVIADFSGRGPSDFGKVNPDITAPGVDVVSSVPGDGYASFSGTSMAAPHTSGTLALMLSAADGIVGDVEAATSALRDTAVDILDDSCGGDEDGDPNNVYGDGRIDAFAAVQLVATGGTLTGTVTASGSGDPLPGVRIEADGADQDYAGFTDPTGVFELFVTAGEYDVTASVYGYGAETEADVAVAEQSETQVDFELDPLPAATVSGTVTDGSGHGWPLYARIEIDGYPGGPVFTDPVTGQYSIELVQSTAFVFHVTAVYGAYVESERAVGPLGSDATEDFSLAVDTAICDAPGYAVSVDGLYEPFASTELPEGWSVVDNFDSGVEWVFDDPGDRGNLTGATGSFAIVDSDRAGFRDVDTELVSPVVDLTTVDAPSLRFATDYLNGGDTAEVDLSIDGGDTWDTILSWDDDMRGPHQEIIELPTAANQSEVRVRFHYFEAFFSFWWQVDNVIIGGEPSCDPVDGGLVVGNVYDFLTDLAINGAHVESDEDADVAADTVATPEDEALDDGFFLLFSPLTGEHAFTASASQYSPDTALVEVTADAVVRQDFSLGAGRLIASPGTVEVTVPMGGTTTDTVSLTNDGTAPASFEISERDGGMEILARRGADVVRRSGSFSPHSLKQAGESGGRTRIRSAPNEAPWTDVASYPTPIMDNTADVFDGRLYSVGGFDLNQNINLAFVYDPDTDSWSEVASMELEREKPAAAFVNGLLYVLGGWDNNGEISTMLEIYDPEADAWGTGADAPAAYAASTAIALDGLLYVIGGCTIDFCGTTDVFVYDPEEDAWSVAASYPREVSWTHCGVIDGQIICAGGVSDFEGELDATYAYDPGEDAWTELAPLPQTQWAGGYVASGGMLLVSGGVTDNFETVTNEGFAYDPAGDSWSPIPASNNSVYRGASACGFYKVGGSVQGFDPIDAVELLPDLDECGVAPDVTWLSEDPVSGSVAADDSTTITLTFDAGVEAVNQPGAYRATLRFKEDTPYTTAPVNVVMNVTPPGDWGKLDGTVEGLERCDTPGAPLRGAAVHVDGVDADFDLKTNGDGYFEWWMPADNDPLTLSAAKAGWVTGTRGSVAIDAGEITTSDFTLRLDAPCAETKPDGLAVTLLQNDSRTLKLRLQNWHGAAGYDFSIEEAPYAFRPLSPLNEVAVNKKVHAAAPTGPLSARSLNDRNGTNVIRPAAPPWFGANDIPGGLVRFGHAQCDGDPNTLYVVGGVDGSFSLSDKLWRFDAATTEWTELAPMPEGSEGPVATCDGGRIHVLGGNGTDMHFVYSIAGDSWTTAAPLPRPVWGAAAASWDGYVFLVGGDDDFFFGGSSDEVDVYDSVTDTWIGTGSPMPVGTTIPGYVQSTHYLYVAGGWGEESPDVNLDAVQRYDLLTDTWEVGPSLGFPRADFALAGTDTALYAIAGDEDGGSPFDATRVVERLELADWPDGAWSEIDRIGVPLTSNNGGFCTTATLDEGTEVWSAGGVEGSSGAISGRMLFRQADGEKCTTYRAKLSWLSESPRTGGVSHDAARTVHVTVDADDLAVGEHDATLLVTTEDPAHPEMRVPIHVTVVARPIVAYLSIGSSATIDGVSLKNEDVFIVHDDDSVEKYFDGSDLGMGGMTIDAFAFAPDGSLVMSFTQPAGVPGITGTVDDSDLVRFVADSLGPDTAGTFVRYFDGSDVGLTSDAEDIDGLSIKPNGLIFISTLGTADLPGLGTADDSDIVKFNPDSLGGNTSGSWSRYFDGSDVGLTTDGEDVDAFALWQGAIGVSTTGKLEVSGLSSADEDVSVFHPTQTGGTTLGSWLARLFDGSHFGLSDNDVSGVEIAP